MAALFAFVLFYAFEFPFSWTRLKGTDPAWKNAFAVSLFSDSLFPACLTAFFYWIFRGSFFKRNPLIRFSSLFLYFSLFAYLTTLTKTVYVRYEPSLYGTLVVPLFWLGFAVTASLIFFLAEQFRSVWSSVLIVCLHPVYALLASAAFAFHFVGRGGIAGLMLLPAFAVPLLLFIVFMQTFVGKSAFAFLRSPKQTRMEMIRLQEAKELRLAKQAVEIAAVEAAEAEKRAQRRLIRRQSKSKAGE